MPKIQGLLDEEMPREKLIKLGPASLTAVELLAIILRVGTKDKNVIELSREILSSFSVSLISRKTYYDLLEFRGISKAKACQIVSVFELSRRLLGNETTNHVQIKNSNSVFDLIKHNFFNLTFEKVMIILVDSKNKVIKSEFIFEGSIDFSYIDTRKIVKLCLSLDASGFFLVHNHPSGDLTPSNEDLDISLKLKQICTSLDLRFLDHLIVCNNEYYSLFDNEHL